MFSYHHGNTEKIANVIAEILDARVKRPQEITPEEFQDCDLIGFGSGIHGGKLHSDLLDLADALPDVVNKEAFVF